MATTFEIISKELIKPLSPTPHNLRHHRLSFLDQINLPSYVPRIFFYRMPSLDRFQLSHQLKQSLSDILTKYYPLAGRINEDGLFVDCNDSGALFVEAQVDALLSESIQRSSSLEELDHYLPIKPYAFWDVTNRDIALGVQISFFECGGIAIGVCISHMVADLMSLVTFVNAWAVTCRGETELLLQPNFDLGYQHFPPRHNPKSPFCKENVEKWMLVKEKVVTKCFVFEKKKLVELKELINAFSSKVKDPTRVEVVSAFILKQLMEINHAKVNPKSRIVFSHSVNLRTRMMRQDHEFAFGNLSPASISDLLMYEKDEKFHDLVSAVRNVTRKFNVGNNVVSSAEDMSKSLAIICKPDIQHCHFTSGCKFLFHEVDYGWGKPLFVCARPLPAKNTVILMDAKCGDGVQALVSLLDEDMELLSNELLSLENNDFSL